MRVGKTGCPATEFVHFFERRGCLCALVFVRACACACARVCVCARVRVHVRVYVGACACEVVMEGQPINEKSRNRNHGSSGHVPGPGHVPGRGHGPAGLGWHPFDPWAVVKDFIKYFPLHSTMTNAELLPAPRYAPYSTLHTEFESTCAQ